MATLLSGRYRIGERLGAGGAAQVFRAHDERLDRYVAVKLLDDDTATSADPSARRRFESEARTAATFVHPNAVTVFDAGSDQGRLFLVMELVTGGSLAERLAALGPMSPTAVRRLATDLGRALAAGHEQGIIHRDVKPSNVLLTDTGAAKLADFGIAKRFDELEDSLTVTGMVIGTRHYISPEQAAGAELTPLTDVYSLGATLFEAATGRRPTAAPDRASGHVLDPTEFVEGFDPGLASTIRTATAVRSDQRFASIDELLQTLASETPHAEVDDPATTATMPAARRPDRRVDPHTRTQAVDGAPPPPVEPPRPAHRMPDRLAHERRRRRFALLAITAVAVLIAGGLVVARNDPDHAATQDRRPVASGPATAAQPTIDLGNDATAPALTASPTTQRSAATVASDTTPAGAELIPGFPAPADAEAFGATLDADPQLAGRRGDDLAREFGKFLDGDPHARAREGEKLRERIDRWLQRDEIDPTIAAAAIAFIAESTSGAPTAVDD